MNTTEIKLALRKRYPAPEFAYFDEVPNGTGGNAARTADGVAMGLWPSRGMEIVGFEIKASRSDWLREKKDPSKAETIQRFCDRWFLVVGDADIVKDGELPPTWGLLVPRAKGLSIKVEAPKLEAQPVGRGFLAAILRRAQGACPGDEALRLARDQATRDADERNETYLEMRMKQAKEIFDRDIAEYKVIAERVRAFQEASGVDIASWRRPQSVSAIRLGQAVKLVLDGGIGVISGRAAAVRAAISSLDWECKRIEQLARDVAQAEAPGEAAAETSAA